MLAKKLRNSVGRGQYLNTVPIIVECSPVQYNNVIRGLTSIGYPVRRSIPRFNMVSTVIGVRSLKLLQKMESVVKVYLDDDIVPPTPGILPLARFFMQNIVQRQSFGFMFGRPIPKNWVPTSKTRGLLGADVAMDDGVDGSGVKVAVLDTGIPPLGIIATHPQLSGQDVIAESVGLDVQPDSSGHGSHVSTTIVGKKYQLPDGTVLHGIAPGVSLMSIKVLETPIGFGRISDILKGLEMAEEWGADIVSMSLGSTGYDPDSPYEPVIANMVKKGIIFSIAAGNDGPNPGTIGTPAGSPHVFAVASVNTNGKTAGFSSRGPLEDGTTKPDTASYGGDNNTDERILSSTSFGSTIDLLDNIVNGLGTPYGTSMATPHFTGVLALCWQYTRKKLDRDMTRDDVWRALKTIKSSKSNQTGYGMLTYKTYKEAVQNGLIS